MTYKICIFRNVVIVAIVLFFILWLAQKDFVVITQNVTENFVEKKTESNKTVKSVDILKEIENLYIIYKEDLLKTRKKAKEFCAKTKIPTGWAHFAPCLYGIAEAELTYLRIRYSKPKYVMEMSSAIGYITFWILQALEDNGEEGVLYSLDVYPTPFPLVLNEDIKKRRWKFFLGDAKVTMIQLENIIFDYIFIDTLHTKEFAKWYIKHIVEKWGKKKSNILVSIHDIYEYTENLLPEGQVVISWLAYSQNAKNVFTLNEHFNPKFWAKYKNIRENVLGLEEANMKMGAYNDELRATIFFEMINSGNDCVNCVEFA